MSAPSFSWFRHDVGDRYSPMSLRLCRLLGQERGDAWLYDLWSFGAQHAPDGLIRVTGEDLEIALRWSGPPGELVAAFLEAGALLRNPLRIADWERRIGAVARESSSRPRPEQALGPPSQHFLRGYWNLLPKGFRHAQQRAYLKWKEQGFDDDAPAAAEARQEIARVLEKQVRNDEWMWRSRSTTAYSYLARRMWEGWAAPPPAPASTTVTVPLLELPQLDDKVRADWRALPGNEDRPWPGIKDALTELRASWKNN
jgi:hypothetical protein